MAPQDAQEALTAAFEADDYIDCIRNLTGWEIDPQAYVDGLDQVCSHLFMHVASTLEIVPRQIMHILPSGSGIYYRCLRALRKTCGIYGVLPASYLVGQGLTLVTPGKIKRPFASGGFSDVWKATDGKGQIFAVKHLRTYETDDLDYMRKVICDCCSSCQYFS